MAVILLDSNAIVAVLDRGDPFHNAATERLRQILADRDRAVASVITFAEIMTGAGLGHHSKKAVRAIFDTAIADTIPVTVEIAERAAELRTSRKSLRLADAVIIATAELYPAETIITADRAWTRLRNLQCSIEALRLS
jgi:predicted nucleic acid-binding protein